MDKGQLPEGRQRMHSVLFSLRNARDFPLRKFAPKEEMKDYAICCMSGHCAGVGGGADIRESEGYDNVVDAVCDFKPKIATCAHSYTPIGTNAGDRTTYANDTDFEFVFTGREVFVVKEIEVFEFAHQTTLSVNTKKWVFIQRDDKERERELVTAV
jgi:hypothetical protein